MVHNSSLREKSRYLRITVFICTYNRGNLINETLKSIIVNQKRKPDEIIVVNGGGENNCQNTLDKWEILFNNLKVVCTKNNNLAASRNVGLSYCLGDIILQTDDDARPFPNWIEGMVKAHKNNPDCGVIGGRVIDASSGNFL